MRVCVRAHAHVCVCRRVCAGVLGGMLIPGLKKFNALPQPCHRPPLRPLWGAGGGGGVRASKVPFCWKQGSRCSEQEEVMQ